MMLKENIEQQREKGSWDAREWQEYNLEAPANLIVNEKSSRGFSSDTVFMKR